MKRPFDETWFGGGGGGSEREKENEERYKKQLRSDEEYARKLFEEEEREERKRLAQEKADEEIARKLSESFLVPSPSKDFDHIEVDEDVSFIEYSGYPATKRREQIENDELLAISLTFTDSYENNNNNNSNINNYNDDDEIQYIRTERLNNNDDDNDKKASMLIACVRDELHMPEINIHSLLCEFNRLIFNGKLDSVSISWSKQMKLCAGICRYCSGGFCEVRLSEPLLKFRPRADFINTLLHEMIHAYLFVTHNNKDHDGHGPEFLGWADRINKKFGTNITVYHNFHDEVDYYKTHWWQCNGPCKSKPPYFGLVKRSMNRPPGPTDHWWSKHQQTCGGTFVKIKSPDPPPKKKGASSKAKTAKGKKPESENTDERTMTINDYFK